MSYKNLVFALLSVAILSTSTSCRQPGHRRTVISINENGNIQKVEYSGTVVFDEQKTGIDYISDGGFLKYEHNGQKIKAEGDDKGRVKYEYNGNAVTKLDEPGKALLAEAAKAVTEQKAKVNAEQGR
ncbi:hypothetical protein A0256_21110 [Mucilaginibacter sp. PAMC 26640]|nr:hypothetical protein A0256_21110 [Mucilaginibacter sp. PAMC 26640]